MERRSGLGETFLGDGFDLHREGQAVLDGERFNSCIDQSVKVPEQLDHLQLQRKIGGVRLLARAVFSAKLHVLHDARRSIGVEDRFASANSQALDAAEVDALHQLNQVPAGWRQQRLKGGDHAGPFRCKCTSDAQISKLARPGSDQGEHVLTEVAAGQPLQKEGATTDVAAATFRVAAQKMCYRSQSMSEPGS